MNELLIVTADDQGYVVIDDEREDRKYRACVLAGVTSLTCDVRSASNPGAREDVLVDTIDCISVASADLCGRLGNGGIWSADCASCRAASDASRRECDSGSRGHAPHSARAR